MADEREISTNIDKFVRDLLGAAIEKRASDIHIEAFESYGKIRMRIDGVLSEYMRLARGNYDKLLTKIKLMAQMDIAERRLPQDANLKLIEFTDIDFRLSTINTVNGEKLVIRILSVNVFEKTKNLLGFSEPSKEKISKNLTKKSGMIIFSGPTGSGKSTSLYSLINKLNTGKENIITVEDPVEYKIEGVNQVAVNTKINLSFAKALRSILRQDPDIIMIGEIRDIETAQIAIRAAITGHLVLTTLHTRDAISSVIRLEDLGIENYLLTSALSLLASQRLVRKLCDCKIEDIPTDYEYEILKKYIEIDKDQKIFRPKGCPKCTNGYLGREAVEEVILIDRQIKEIIKTTPLNKEKLNQALADQNFEPMMKNALAKVLNGTTSLEEVLEVLDFD